MADTKQVAVEIKMTHANDGVFDGGGHAVDVSNYLIATQGPRSILPYRRPRVATVYHGPFGSVLQEMHKEDPRSELVYRTAMQFGELYEVRPDVTLFVFQNIPIRKGSGASAAARGSVWAALSLLYGANLRENGTLDEDKIIGEVAKLEGHADNIAPAIKGGYVYIIPQQDDSVVYRKHAPIPGHGEILIDPPFEKQSTDILRPPVLAFRTDRDGAHNALYRAGMVFKSTGRLGADSRDVDRIATSLVDQLGDEVTMPEIASKGLEVFAYLDTSFGVVQRNPKNLLETYGEHSINDETYIKARASFRPIEGVNQSAFGPYFYDDLLFVTDRVRRHGGYLRIRGAGPGFGIAHYIPTTPQHQIDAMVDEVVAFLGARGYTRDQLKVTRTIVPDTGLRVISHVTGREELMTVAPSMLRNFMALEPLRVAASKVRS